MQLFRPFENHQQSAQYLDNRRLNKQVLETYQISRVCLGALGLIEANTAYLRHPIVAHVYHQGQPYLPDTLAYLRACDYEFQRRGGKRGAKFAVDLHSLATTITNNEAYFSNEPLPPLFIYGEIREEDPKQVFLNYQHLLQEKWLADTVPAKCSWSAPTSLGNNLLSV